MTLTSHISGIRCSLISHLDDFDNKEERERKGDEDEKEGAQGDKVGKNSRSLLTLALVALVKTKLEIPFIAKYDSKADIK